MTAAIATRQRSSRAVRTGLQEPVELRTADGSRRSRPLAAASHTAVLAELLYSSRPGLVEVVAARRRRDGHLARFERGRPESFLPAADRDALVARVQELAAGARREVFFTPATLSRPLAGNAAVSESAIAWVDIDDPRRLSALRHFPHPPHAVIASGSGGAHAYWRLAEALEAEHCEELNRKLAAALGADPVCFNRGRIMRAPGSRNYKAVEGGTAGAWCRVVMCDLARAPYSACALGAGLLDPRAPKPARSNLRRWHVDRGTEPWLELEPADYYRAITGDEPRRDGRVRCPNASHEDRHPSAQLYRGPGTGWYCFSCGAGGGAVDLVAAIHGWPTGRELRGEQFRECVAELRALFGVAPSPQGERLR